MEITPLAWSTDQSRIDAFINREATEVTIVKYPSWDQEVSKGGSLRIHILSTFIAIADFLPMVYHRN